ncbi:MAG: ABC transporter ATP-binding protein [Acidobacteriota bacterium]
MTMIEIDNLTHDYASGIFRRRRWRALDAVNFRVESGQVLGLLGPNGAGKTTLFKVMLGMLRPTAGTIRVNGQDAAMTDWKRSLGYLPEQPSFYEYLTAREFLVYGGRLSGLAPVEAERRAIELLTRVGLREVAHRPLRKFSKGMQQRVGLAQALINDPRILLLDEPMSGLDPLGRRLVRETIATVRASGGTIIFSSHNLADVEMLADRVVLLAAGRVVGAGTVAALIHDRRTELEVVVAGIDEETRVRLGTFVARVEATSDGACLILDDEERLPALLEMIHRAGGRLISVNPLHSSLEDWFLERVRGEVQRGNRTISTSD